MTLPPCKPNGVDCPSRYIGCRAECEEYHKWIAIHSEEKEAQDAYRNSNSDACAFTRDIIHRIAKRNNSRKKVGQR